MVLANLGYKPERMADELKQAIRDRNRQGRGVVEMMATIPPAGWCTRDIVSEVTGWLDADTSVLGAYEVESAIMALGMLGERAGDAGTKLRALANRDSDSVVLIWLALAAVDHANCTESLRAALPHVPDGRGTLALGRWLPRDLLEPIRRLLCDRDPDVVRGALRLLVAAGPKARDVAGDYLNVLRTNLVAECRELAAVGLCVVGNVSTVPYLEAIAAGEQSERVRAALKETIRILQLERREGGGRGG